MVMIRVCDFCGSDKDVEHHFFVTDRKLDAAGSPADEGQGFDVCLTCCGKLFRSMLRSKCMTYELGDFLVKKSIQLRKLRLKEEREE